MASWRRQGRTHAGGRRAFRGLPGVLPGVPLWVPVVIAPLLAGTAERPYTLYLAALCAGAGLWGAIRTWRRSERLPASWFAVALLLAIAATLIQCVPLPGALRAALAPGSDALLRTLTAGSGARALPLSVDPGATAHEAVRLGGYLCLLLSLGTMRTRRGSSLRLGWVLCGSAGAVAGLGALAALGVPLPSLWAIPAGGATRALLPALFYNSNHMAALLGAGATVTMGAALQVERRGPRFLCGLLLALQNLALLGTLSRTGIVVGLGGQLLVLLSSRWAGLRDAGWRRLALLAAPLLAVLLVVENPAWLGGLRLRFTALSPAELLADGSKVRAWLDALPLFRGHWALGVGRGAFEDVFAGYHRLAGATRFVYLENEWLQAIADWGLPVGLGLGGLLGLGLRDAVGVLWRRRHSAEPERSAESRGASSQVAEPEADAGRGRMPLRQAALIALLGLLLHDLADFSLEVGGVAAAAVALVALIEKPRFTVAPQWGIGLAAATLLGTVVVGGLCPGHEEEGTRLRQLAESSEHSAAQVVAAGTEAVRRHPLDAYLYATVAARLWHERDGGAVTWINRALTANPRELLARRTSAMVLADTGHREQALRTLALAIADADRAQRRWLLQTARSLARTPAELLLALPESSDELPSGLSAAMVADELLALLGEDSATGLPWPMVRAVAERGRARGGTTALGWLGRAVLAQRDAAAAIALLPELQRAGTPPLLLADLLALIVDAGALDAAEQLLRTALVDERSAEVLLTAARLQERRGRLPAARALLDTAQTEAPSAVLRARVHEVRAELEARAGNLYRAQLEREAAEHLRP